ncbi:MAG: (d)CMP kinase [Anaplasma sp.]
MIAEVSDDGQHTQPQVIIAVDGPSSSGKGTLAKELASILHFRYLDTGKLYRVFASKFLREHAQNLASDAEMCLDEKAQHEILSLLDDNDPKYYTELVGKAASMLARNKAVRAAMVQMQRQFIYSTSQGVVVDGRDIASVVCPTADVKLFINAYAAVRARRRFKQLQNSPHRSMYKSVFFHLLHRDVRDSRRKTAPLTRVSDALYLDNSHMDKKTTLLELMKKIKTFL